MIKDPFNGWPAPTKVQHGTQHTLQPSVVVHLLQSLYKMKMLSAVHQVSVLILNTFYTLFQPTQVV